MSQLPRNNATILTLTEAISHGWQVVHQDQEPQIIRHTINKWRIVHYTQCGVIVNSEEDVEPVSQMIALHFAKRRGA